MLLNLEFTGAKFYVKPSQNYSPFRVVLTRRFREKVYTASDHQWKQDINILLKPVLVHCMETD